jgi:hypothetical protein
VEAGATNIKRRFCNAVENEIINSVINFIEINLHGKRTARN